MLTQIRNARTFPVQKLDALQTIQKAQFDSELEKFLDTENIPENPNEQTGIQKNKVFTKRLEIGRRLGLLSENSENQVTVGPGASVLIAPKF